MCFPPTPRRNLTPCSRPRTNQGHTDCHGCCSPVGPPVLARHTRHRPPGSSPSSIVSLSRMRSKVHTVELFQSDMQCLECILTYGRYSTRCSYVQIQVTSTCKDGPSVCAMWLCPRAAWHANNPAKATGEPVKSALEDTRWSGSKLPWQCSPVLADFISVPPILGPRSIWV